MVKREVDKVNEDGLEVHLRVLLKEIIRRRPWVLPLNQ